VVYLLDEERDLFMIYFEGDKTLKRINADIDQYRIQWSYELPFRLGEGITTINRATGVINYGGADEGICRPTSPRPVANRQF
jgi:hypothetical protein